MCHTQDDIHNTPEDTQDEVCYTQDDAHNTPDDTQDEVCYTQDDTHNTPDDILDKILHFCIVARSKKEIANYLGIKDDIHLRRKYLIPLIKEGYLSFMFPDKKTSKYQKYIKKEDVIKR